MLCSYSFICICADRGDVFVLPYMPHMAGPATGDLVLVAMRNNVPRREALGRFMLDYMTGACDVLDPHEFIGQC